MTLYKWSQTATDNATADSTAAFPEGMAAGSVNDMTRGAMAAVAKYRDDIAGAIVTGGSSTAYTVTSYQTFDTLANMDGQMIAFTPHATNGATVTLNVDGLGAKPLRTAPSVELQSNVLILGTPYVALYNNSDAVWYLQNMASNTYGIPLAAGMDFWGSTAPSSAFAFPAGQAISRTTYATLFALVSTTYGTGDGSTTFNLPDKTGRVSAMKEASASRLTTTYFGAASGSGGATLGAVGGNEATTLNASLIPTLTSTGSNAIFVSSSLSTYASGFSSGSNLTNSGNQYGAGSPSPVSIGAISSTGTNSISVTSSGTGGATTNVQNVQPTIVCNYIMRII